MSVQATAESTGQTTASTAQVTQKTDDAVTKTQTVDSSAILPGAGNQDDMAEGMKALLPQGQEEAPAETAKAKDGESGESAPNPDDMIDVQIPEGFQKDEALMNSFYEAIKKTESKKEMAQKLFDMHVEEQGKLASGIQKRIEEARDKQNREWYQACRNDPEFGGEKYNQSCNYLLAGVQRFLPREEAKEFFDFYKNAQLNNVPTMWKFLVRVGMATSEAGPVMPDAQSAKTEMTVAQRMFPPEMGFKSALK